MSFESELDEIKCTCPVFRLIPCTSFQFLHDDVHFPDFLACQQTRARISAKCTAACKEMAEVPAETGVRRAF